MKLKKIIVQLISYFFIIIPMTIWGFKEEYFNIFTLILWLGFCNYIYSLSKNIADWLFKESE